MVSHQLLVHIVVINIGSPPATLSSSASVSWMDSCFCVFVSVCVYDLAPPCVDARRRGFPLSHFVADSDSRVAACNPFARSRLSAGAGERDALDQTLKTGTERLKQLSCRPTIFGR